MVKKPGLIQVVIGVLGIILVFTLFSTVLSSMWSLRETSTSEIDTTNNVSTNVSITYAYVYLDYSLLDDDVANIDAITSTIGGDVPIADNYTEPQLWISGLAANVTAGDGRTLTVPYSHDIMGYFTGFDTITAITPAVLFLGALAGFSMLTVSGYVRLVSPRKP